MGYEERKAKQRERFAAALRMEQALAELRPMVASGLDPKVEPYKVAQWAGIALERWEALLRTGLLGGVRPCSFQPYGCKERALAGDSMCGAHAEAVSATAESLRVVAPHG